MIEIWTVEKCVTCRTAKAWLRGAGIEFQEYAIRESPPSRDLLFLALSMVGPTKVLNTSGAEYREPGLKEKIANLSHREVAALLSSRGGLVRRPFVRLSDGRVLTGFNEEQWRRMMVSGE